MGMQLKKTAFLSSADKCHQECQVQSPKSAIAILSAIDCGLEATASNTDGGSACSSHFGRLHMFTLVSALTVCNIEHLHSPSRLSPSKWCQDSVRMWLFLSELGFYNDKTPIEYTKVESCHLHLGES